MKWILIVILSGPWGVSMSMQEFEGFKGCRYAGAQIAKISVATEAQIQYACAPSRSPYEGEEDDGR